MYAAAMQAAIDEHGRLDAVCNVAGLGDAMLIKDITAEHYDRLMNVNLHGVLFGIRHGARAMVKAGNGGSIINWSSIGGLNGSLMVGIYERPRPA